MDLPLEDLRSLRIAAGPIFCKWSALGFVIIVSQITASFVVFWVEEGSVEGHEAETQTNTCLVFQVKREERSVVRENLICAYSSFFVE